MNRKKIKVLRRKAKKILVEWLKSLLPEEEQDKVNVNNILQLMPKQTHYINEFQLYLSAWSFKWVMKKFFEGMPFGYKNNCEVLYPSVTKLKAFPKKKSIKS